MTSSGPPPDLWCLSAHARGVPMAGREAFAQAAHEATEGLSLLTCHRVEWYGTDAEVATRLAERLPEGGEVRRGTDAGRHAIAVAMGLDSVVVGEDQILHQLRRSVAVARSERRLGPSLEHLFALALRAGRRARSWRGGPARSLADVAVDQVARHPDWPASRRVLIVGAGEMGRLVAHAAAAAGAQVALANRTAAAARDLAGPVGADVVPFDPGPQVAGMAGVIVALRGPWPLDQATMDRLATSDSIVVDLSTPPAVARSLVDRLGNRFLSIDDLARRQPTLSVGPTAREAALVESTVADFRAWLDGHSRRDAARALAERVELDRRAELAELWRRLPDLEPASRSAIEQMSRHLTERVLRGPLERLGDDIDGDRARAVRDLWAL